MDRIKGVRLGIYKYEFSELIREYQDPDGWAITDAGVNEDQNGYFFYVDAIGYKGEARQISVVLTKDALTEMLNTINERFYADADEPLPEVSVTNVDRCCDGECCGSLS